MSKPGDIVAWYIHTHGMPRVALKKEDLGLLANRYAVPLRYPSASAALEDVSGDGVGPERYSYNRTTPASAAAPEPVTAAQEAWATLTAPPKTPAEAEALSEWASHFGTAAREQEVPYSNWVWQHVKSGGEYSLLGDARLQTDQPLKDMAEVYVYQGADGRMWARPVAEFDARFKRIRPASLPPVTAPQECTTCGALVVGVAPVSAAREQPSTEVLTETGLFRGACTALSLYGPGGREQEGEPLPYELSDEEIKLIIRMTPGPDGYRAALVRAGFAWGIETARSREFSGPLVPIAPDSRKGKPPCSECHLKPGETCDICGAKEPPCATPPPAAE